MKVCLVRPLLSSNAFNGYPLNLLILASAIREKGHVPFICDYDFYKEIDPTWISEPFAVRAAEDILAHEPDMVGITAMCSNYVLAVELAGEIKRKAPHVHITFGGPHVSLCPVETLDSFKAVDSCVVGEGEVTFPELLDALEHHASLEGIPGVHYRDDQGNAISNGPRPLIKDIMLSPRPAYDLIDMRAYIEHAEDIYMQVYAGSGCPFDCSFCSTSIVWERKYRVMGAERVVNEIEYLHRTYGVTHFNLVHDNLSSNKPYIHGIAEQILERGLDIHWGFSSRIDTLDEKTCRIASAAGCNYIFFGVESASEHIQHTMGKRLKISKIHQTIRNCLENGIMPTTSFILGFPEEQQEDIEATIRLAFACKVVGAWRSFINLLSPYTGTRLMRNSEKLVLDWENVNTSMVIFLEDQHKKEIEKNPFIYANFYFLDYSRSYMQEGGYSNIVDFYTMCLFKYPYTIHYLINDLQLSPLDIYEFFREQVTKLTPAQRDQLDIQITEEDLIGLAGEHYAYNLVSCLRYDQSIVFASKAGYEGQVLYKGSLYLPDEIAPNLLEQEVILPGIRYFLHENKKGHLATYELTPQQFAAFEQKDLSVYYPERWEMNVDLSYQDGGKRHA
ncbi:radical SAM protein [Paenibacillus sp. ClWae2A]|uniref:B12-binding domain-containing radical SAM protein n=1 Tax=Paenibacillus sp. ClWae2A TaxID=3057177 RepID=UPI0028F53527|nr:radical SAM protein [Paenibacillus sp. ClWae2A]MDT9721100.1 radical SAM protein [Paenibacillus sp. ClWae2A]